MSLPFAILIISAGSLVVANFLMAWVKKRDLGDPGMQKVSQAIKTGAIAFLKRQYKTISLLALATALVIFVFYSWNDRPDLGRQTALAFLLGAASSALAGVISMRSVIAANIRVAAATKKGLGKSLTIALRSGGVAGITIIALSLLGVVGMFLVYSWLGYDIERIPSLIAGYAFGASFVALFAQLGGGIFTKAADVGADLVGKIEAGIPEDDPRNPAVIADLVGDNVGDCAGRGADIFESTAAESIGAMILGAALYPIFGLNGILFPLVIQAAGLIASIIGITSARAKEGEPPMKTLNRGFLVTALISVVAFFFVNKYMLGNVWFFWAGLVGILTSIVFLYLTQYYTSKNFRPVRSIAEASKTGHATNIIAGYSVGLESTGLTVITISSALIIAFKLGVSSGVTGGGLYGTAIATMGMLVTAAYILAMDVFGPITDNAGGIVEMSGGSEEMRNVTDELDAAGNTTKALTKGYAIGSASLAAFLLFSAYLEEVKITIVDLTKIDVFVGALIGAALIFVFSSLTIRAVGKAAGYIIEEVRRQFKEKPGIMLGSDEPDYSKAVDITTKGALREMRLPGILVVITPLIIGLWLKAEAVAGLLMVGTISGILMATTMNNAGGAWDNAKKWIETGQFGGKRSPAHQAAVTGDTVGDPFKDAAGPSLHVVIKLLATLSLALAVLFV